MKKYSIRDIEKLTGINVFTLRAWEKRYCIAEPTRTPTNIRCYCENDLKRILNISILLQHGYKISKVACLDNESLNRLIHEIGKNAQKENVYTGKLTIAMTEMNEELANETLREAIEQKGLETTMTDVVYPFLQKSTVLWQTDAVTTAQQQFISHIIRQKLIVAANQLVAPKTPRGSFLLFLPLHETQEIGLLFYNYLLRKKGYRVTYLGAAVPFEDVVAAEKARPADNLLTFFVTSITDNELQQYINRMKSAFPGKNIFISGNCFLKSSVVSLPEGMIRTSCVKEFSELLK